MAEEANKPKITMDVDPFAETQPTPDMTIGGEPVAEPLNEEPQVIEQEQKEEVNEETQEQVQVEPTQESETQDSEEPQAEALEEASNDGPEIVEINDSEEEVEVINNEVEQELAHQVESNIDLPEGVDKLVDFIRETGGSLEDYMKLNQDFSTYSDERLLMEYYAQTKPQWDKQDILDHIEDEFTVEDYEEGMELDRSDRRKLRLRKEEIANAKKFLEGNKEKYYENIKMNSQALSQQQIQEQQAQEEAQAQAVARFQNQTKEFFGNDFKGFDFDAGDKKFRIKENAQNLLDSQIDLSSVLQKHLSEDGSVINASEYHKAVYAFRNADKLFSQAYQQGKADAIKERAESTKNIDMTPKTTETTSTINKKPKLSMQDPFGLENNF